MLQSLDLQSSAVAAELVHLDVIMYKEDANDTFFFLQGLVHCVQLPLILQIFERVSKQGMYREKKAF